MFFSCFSYIFVSFFVKFEFAKVHIFFELLIKISFPEIFFACKYLSFSD